MKRLKRLGILLSLLLVLSVLIPAVTATSDGEGTENPEIQSFDSTEYSADPSGTENGDPEDATLPGTDETDPACTCGLPQGEAHTENCPLYVGPDILPEAPDTTCTCGAAEGMGHTEGCPLYIAPEPGTDGLCTCGAGEGLPHMEGCPLYENSSEEDPFLLLYQRLMAAQTMDEWEQICAACTDQQLMAFEQWLAEQNLLDSLQNHIATITPPPVVPETVVFTAAGPFMPPVHVAADGSN